MVFLSSCLPDFSSHSAVSNYSLTQFHSLGLSTTSSSFSSSEARVSREKKKSTKLVVFVLVIYDIYFFIFLFFLFFFYLFFSFTIFWMTQFHKWLTFTRHWTVTYHHHHVTLLSLSLSLSLYWKKSKLLTFSQGIERRTPGKKGFSVDGSFFLKSWRFSSNIRLKCAGFYMEGKHFPRQRLINHLQSAKASHQL